MKKGLLLINLGTPDSTKLWDVWKYLAEFLMDERVLVMPVVIRFLLLYGCILPFRVLKTQKAYRLIWTKQGSPLRVQSEELCQKLQKKFKRTYQIALGMRYGSPSIESALKQLHACEELVILPLYPQYASATTGSSLAAVFTQIAKQTRMPAIKVIAKFYDHPAFIQAQSQIIASFLKPGDHLVFSYHGLPEQHLTLMGCPKICEGDCPVSVKDPAKCYRAQCFQTSDLLTKALGLEQTRTTTVFQSRLGYTPWIKPYMEETLQTLAAQKIKRIVVACPSFVADCLETLEEIGVRMRAQWQILGGERLTLIPCLNAQDVWCGAIETFISQAIE